MRWTRNGVLLTTLLYICCGLFFFSYRYLEKGANNRWPDWRPDFINEMTGVVAGYILLWPLFWFTNRFPILRGRVARNIGMHALVMPVWSFLHTTLLATLRPIFYALVLHRGYDFGILPLRYLMEFSFGGFVFWAQVAAIATLRSQYEIHRRELRTAELERELTQAHLDALRLQLRPHFLFNALNAVSSVMYEDPRKADRMIASLSDFLRAVLRQESTHTVSLREELRLLGQYLSIMQVRFGDRMHVAVDVPEALQEALVPPLLLQPLVENCVQHGVDPSTGELRIEIRAIQTERGIRFTVRDHGPGIGNAPAPVNGHSGVGLNNTKRRLERLYENNQHFALTAADGGGAMAAVELPLEMSPEAATDEP